MLKLLSLVCDRDIYIITKSLLDEYLDSRIETKEKRDKIKPSSEYGGDVIVSDDIVGSIKSKFIA